MRYFYYLFISFFLLVSLVPAFGSVDKAGSQWVYVSIINIFIFSFFLLNSKKLLISSFYKFKIVIVYSFFVFLCTLSLIYTNNIIISVVDLSHIFTIYFSFLLLLFIYISLNPSFNILFSLIVFVLTIESLFSLYPIFYAIYSNGFEFLHASSINIDAFIGLTGNRNITTASLVVKLPFLFYLIFNTQKIILKSFMTLLVILISLPLFIIGSRAALISFCFIVFCFACYSLYNFYITKRKLNLINLLIITLSVGLSFFVSFVLIPSNDSNVIDRVSSIDFTNEASSNRFILWGNAFDYISNNPLIGAGLGNWKVESSLYWGSLGDNYLVPYHAHNDFLQFTTELGIIGGLSYFMIFLVSFYYILVLSRLHKLLSITFFTSLVAYSIDASLNFPFDRPIMQVSLVFIIAGISYASHLKKSH